MCGDVVLHPPHPGGQPEAGLDLLAERDRLTGQPARGAFHGPQLPGQEVAPPDVRAGRPVRSEQVGRQSAGLSHQISRNRRGLAGHLPAQSPIDRAGVDHPRHQLVEAEYEGQVATQHAVRDDHVGTIPGPSDDSTGHAWSAAAEGTPPIEGKSGTERLDTASMGDR